jgi:hypothetical protein
MPPRSDHACGVRVHYGSARGAGRCEPSNLIVKRKILKNLTILGTDDKRKDQIDPDDSKIRPRVAQEVRHPGYREARGRYSPERTGEHQSRHHCIFSAACGRIIVLHQRGVSRGSASVAVPLVYICESYLPGQGG